MSEIRSVSNELFTISEWYEKEPSQYDRVLDCTVNNGLFSVTGTKHSIESLENAVKNAFKNNFAHVPEEAVVKLYRGLFKNKSDGIKVRQSFNDNNVNVYAFVEKTFLNVEIHTQYDRVTRIVASPGLAAYEVNVVLDDLVKKLNKSFDQLLGVWKKTMEYNK